MMNFPKKTDYGLKLFDDELFDDLFSFPVFKNQNASTLMKTDILEEDKNYVFMIDMPGVKKEEVEISLDDGYLNISLSVKKEKDKKGYYLRKERYQENCSRSFYVGEIEEKSIDASYKDGILKIKIPKEEVTKEKEKKLIQIK